MIAFYAVSMHRLWVSDDKGTINTATLATKLRGMRDANPAFDLRPPNPAYAYVGAAPLGHADQARVHAIAPLDNIGVFASLGTAGGNIQKCIFRTVDIAPFSAASVGNSTVGLDGLYLADVISTLRTGLPALKIQQVIAECLVPNWPIDKNMAQNEARAELTRLLNTGAALADQSWFMDVVIGLQRDRQLLNQQAAAAGAAAGGAAAPAVLDINLVGVGNVDLWSVTGRTWHGAPTLAEKIGFIVMCRSAVEQAKGEIHVPCAVTDHGVLIPWKLGAG